MGYPESIQALLEKYWSAETTVEEEQQLRAFFASTGTGADPMATYFSWLSRESRIMMPERRSGTHRRPVAIRRALSIAASILLLIAAGYFITRPIDNDSTAIYTAVASDTFDDPAEAYAEARQALLLVADKLNRTRAFASEQISKTDVYTELIR